MKTKIIILGLFLILALVSAVFLIKTKEENSGAQTVKSETKLASESVEIAKPRKIDETSYYVRNGKIFTSYYSNEVIQTLSDNVQKQLAEESSEYFTSNQAVPKPNIANKYYIEMSSPVQNDQCKFFNKIFVFDADLQKITLLYEENEKTLNKNDFRACNKNIILLGTEADNLIVFYHTKETGGVCDNLWAYPERIWYLDTSKPHEGTKPFSVPTELYEKAKAEVEACQREL